MQSTEQFLNQFDRQKYFCWILRQNGEKKAAYQPMKPEPICEGDSRELLTDTLENGSAGVYTITLKKTTHSGGENLSHSFLHKMNLDDYEQEKASKKPFQSQIGSTHAQNFVQGNTISLEKYEALQAKCDTFKDMQMDLKIENATLKAKNEVLTEALNAPVEERKDKILGFEQADLIGLVKHIFTPAQVPSPSIGTLDTPKKQVPKAQEEDESNEDFSFSEQTVLQGLEKKVLALDNYLSDDDPFEFIDCTLDFCSTLCKIAPSQSPTEIVKKFNTLAAKNPQMVHQILAM